MMKKTAVVVHSGGMDSSICLAIAKEKYGPDHVLSLSFNYQQRTQSELIQAKKIADDWDVGHREIAVSSLAQVTNNALIDTKQVVNLPSDGDGMPNTWVTGRNGLLARLAAIYAHQLKANVIYLGVIETADGSSGYPDCSSQYIRLLEEVLQLDLMNPSFQIVAPLVDKTKLETLELAQELGVLSYLLNHTVSCYEGIMHEGCRQCPACELRNKSLIQFQKAHPDISLPYHL